MNIHNIGSWIARRAEILPEKPALIQGDQTLTYVELASRIDRLAQALLAEGLEEGDRVAVLSTNSLAYLELTFACARAGLVLVPLNWRLAAEELAYILNDSGSRALLYEPAFSEVVAKLATGADARGEGRAPALRIRVGGEGEEPGARDYETFLAGGEDTPPPAEPRVEGHTPHLIMYTAGTTGQPKGVVLTHENTLYQCLNAIQLGLTPDVVGLAVLPFFHVGGMHGSALPVLYIGGTLVVQARFDPGETLALLERHRVQGMVGVPAMFLFMAQHPRFGDTDLSSVAVFTAGGAPLPVPLIETYEKRGVVFRQGYGLTECSAGVTGMDPADAYRKAGSAGRPCFYTEVRVVDPDSGDPLPANEAGEIVVRGPNVTSGYWNRPEETAEALRDGWFHTGDIGRIDEEGYVWLVDRRKEMIISGGENIFPAEIENALFSHPAVKECAVFGVPDDRFGERPVAVVVPHPGTEPDAGILLAHLEARIARYKLPRDIHVRAEALPRNAAGKVLKQDLRAQVIQA